VVNHYIDLLWTTTLFIVMELENDEVLSVMVVTKPLDLWRCPMWKFQSAPDNRIHPHWPTPYLLVD